MRARIWLSPFSPLVARRFTASEEHVEAQTALEVDFSFSEMGVGSTASATA